MPADKGLVRSRSHYGSTVIITCLIRTPVQWWKEWLILMWSREDHIGIEDTKDGWGLWCYARIKGKDRAHCGHVMITMVLLVPSLIWSWGDRVMTMMVSGSCGGYEVTPNRVSWCMILLTCCMLVSSFVHAMLIWYCSSDILFTLPMPCVLIVSCSTLLINL